MTKYNKNVNLVHVVKIPTMQILEAIRLCWSKKLIGTEIMIFGKS